MIAILRTERAEVRSMCGVKFVDRVDRNTGLEGNIK